MRNRSSLYAVLAIIALIATPIGCASSGYATASQDYDAGSRAYAQAFGTLQSLHDSGRLSAPTWAQFLTLSEAERVADTAVFADLTAWKESGKRPATYSANSEALLVAQNAVINLAAGAPR